jgi:hypothetical protein
MNKPSSTIQSASIAGLGMSLLWLLIPEFTDYEVSPQIVAASTAFVMAVVGYFKKENVLGAAS